MGRLNRVLAGRYEWDTYCYYFAVNHKTLPQTHWCRLTRTERKAVRQWMRRKPFRLPYGSLRVFQRSDGLYVQDPSDGHTIKMGA